MTPPTDTVPTSALLGEIVTWDVQTMEVPFDQVLAAKIDEVTAKRHKGQRDLFPMHALADDEGGEP